MEFKLPPLVAGPAPERKTPWSLIRSFSLTRNRDLDIPVFHESELVLSSSFRVSQVARLLFGSELEFRESFFIIAVDNRLKVIGTFRAGVGGDVFTPVSVRTCLLFGVSCLATSVFLCHNHPSGGVQPSQNDDNLTKQLIAAYSAVGVRVIDHIIVDKTSYFSYADEGALSSL